MIRFAFVAPAERLSLNSRVHWGKRFRLNTAWKLAAWLHAMDIANRCKLRKPLGPSRVHVEFVVAQRRRRDADNAMACVKPILDGLVAAGWFPDDSTEHVQPSVSFTVDPKNASWVVVTVTPWEAAA